MKKKGEEVEDRFKNKKKFYVKQKASPCQIPRLKIVLR